MTLHRATQTQIFFNPTKLQRLLDNTLSNAIKFSHKNGKINVYISKNEKDGICLMIQDYGQGMKHPEKITNRYYREQENKNGFGIGMNIVKSIVDKSNITMNIQSTYLKGTTVTYVFNKSLLIDKVT